MRAAGKGGGKRFVRPWLLACGLVLLPGSALPAPQEPSDLPRCPSYLLLCDWFGTSPAATPSFVRDHARFLDSLPVDGLALTLRRAEPPGNLSAAVLSDQPLDPEAMRGTLAPLRSLSFEHLRHNFAAVVGGSPPDVFDDWGAVVENMASLARASREAALEGILLDNEPYGRRWIDYPAGVKYRGKPLEAYVDQTRLRGRQVMEAVTGAYPRITVLVLHGPYVSDPLAPHPLFPDWAQANRLSGAFFAGLVEGAGDASTVVDGGELYHLREREDFRKSRQWRRSEFPSERHASPSLSPQARARWARAVSIGFGIYDRPFGGAPMSPSDLERTVERALLETDRYAWLYIEGPTFLLPPGEGGAPTEWIRAVRTGKEAALRARPR